MLKRIAEASETKWKYYISALQISFVCMCISVFGFGRVSEYLMQLGLYMSVTTGILVGITLSNIDNGDFRLGVLLSNTLNGIIIYANVMKYLGIEVYSQESIVLFEVCLGASFMLLCAMTVFAAIIYVTLFK